MLQPPIIKTYKLSKSYNGTHALKDIEIEINAGQITALVGVNGAGKSTFMKLLYGEIQPTNGYFELNGKKIKLNSPQKAIKNGIIKISQDFDLFDELSIAENIYLYTKERKTYLYNVIDANNYALNSFSILKYKIDINRKINQLDVTEKQIVSIAKAVSKKPQLLILDEPTSVLNLNEVSTLFSILKEIIKTGTSVVFISHKLEEVFSISDRIIVIKDGIITLDSETSKTIKDDVIFAMLGRQKNLNKNISTVETNNTSVSLLNLNNCSGPEFHNLSFEILKSETLGLISKNRQSLINIIETIYGLNKLNSGKIKINNKDLKIRNPIQALNNGIGYLPEDRRNEGLFYNLSLFDNIAIIIKKKNSIIGYLKKHLLEKKVLAISKKLNIISSSLNQPISEISGGNQQKALFARLLVNDTQLFLLSEPTAGIDISSKLEIYNMIDVLKNEGKSFLITSTDRHELIQLCDRIVKVSDHNITMIFDKSQYINDENILN